VRIREAEPRDARAIAEVQVSSWRTTYPGIVAQSYIDSLSVDGRATVWARILGRETSPESYVVVAEDASRNVVGFVSGGPIRQPRDGYDSELYAIYLLQSSKGVGVGRALVAAWAAHEVQCGRRSAIVRVFADNPARRFYERVGARWLEDGELTIGGELYRESWYAWDDLRAIVG